MQAEAQPKLKQASTTLHYKTLFNLGALRHAQLYCSVVRYSTCTCSNKNYNASRKYETCLEFSSFGKLIVYLLAGLMIK